MKGGSIFDYLKIYLVNPDYTERFLLLAIGLMAAAKLIGVSMLW